MQGIAKALRTTSIDDAFLELLLLVLLPMCSPYLLKSIGSSSTSLSSNTSLKTLTAVYVYTCCAYARPACALLPFCTPCVCCAYVSLGVRVGVYVRACACCACVRCACVNSSLCAVRLSYESELVCCCNRGIRWPW